MTLKDDKEKIKKYNQSPKAKESRKKYRQKPEVKAKLAEYQRKYNKKPEVVAKLREYRKKYNQRPEVKERRRLYLLRPDIQEKIKDASLKKSSNLHIICRELMSAGDYQCTKCNVKYSDKIQNEWIAKHACPCCHKKLRLVRIRKKAYID